MKKTKLYLVLIGLILLTKGGYCSGCGGTIFSASMTKDRRLTDGHFYNATSILTVADCASLCLRVTGCSSFNYELEKTLCELNSVGSVTGTLASATGVIFSDASSWQGPALLGGGCGTRPCGNSEVCVGKDQTFNCVPLTQY